MIEIDQRVARLIADMTLEEKVAQLSAVWVYEVLDRLEFSEDKAWALFRHGIGQITRIGGASNLPPELSARLANQIQTFLREHTRLKIPALVHEEACSGYMAQGATLFPQAIGVASSWNPDVVFRMADVIRRQMRAVGAHQALAPLLDITRDARWGRMEETFGEDPLLTASLGIAFIRGLQAGGWSDRIIATGKHFAGYGFSEGGMNWAPAHIPIRELFEMVLLPFEAAIKEAGLESVMPAYHELDGIPLHAHVGLLREILREAWGFQGTTVSDYFAVAMLEDYHHVAADRTAAARLALDAGVDVELPNRDAYGEPLLAAVKSGLIPLSRVDQAVARVLRHKVALGLFENPWVDETRVYQVFNRPEHDNLALQVAHESIVLLKNEGQLLPLPKTGLRLAVMGPNADSARNLMGDYAFPCHIESLIEMREQGNVFSQPLPESITLDGVLGDMPTIYQAIRQKVGNPDDVIYRAGCSVSGTDQTGFEAAVAAARNADVAILVMGDKAGLTLDCTTGESRDRTDLSLPGVQEAFVEAICQTGTPVVVVLINGRPVTGDWIDKVDALVEAWLPGGQGATAVADVLFGDYNPAGRLAVSFPRTVGQVPVYYNHAPSGGRSHWHGDYVDTSATPRFPFGFGLSYTQFAYPETTARLDWHADDPLSSEVHVAVQVENVGARAGDEVVQVYVHMPSDTVTRPVKELKAYARVPLEPGSQKTLRFILPLEILAYYHPTGAWAVDPGTLDVWIGSSSEHIRAHHQLTLPERIVWPQRNRFTFRLDPS